MKIDPKTIHPLHNLVLVEMAKLSNTIVVVEGEQMTEGLRECTVRAVGPGEPNINGERLAPDDGQGGLLKPGDTVLMLPSMCYPIPGLDDYWMVPVPALVAVLSERLTPRVVPVEVQA